jgi:ribosomal protein S18 acetylase RimI-like enzyme
MPIGHQGPGGPPVTVRPMTQQEYDGWRAGVIESYAQDLAASSGVPLQVARADATAQFPRLLPDGLATPGNWLLRVLDTHGEDVGALWLGPSTDRAGMVHVFDIEILPEHQGRGLGRAAMLAAEDLLREAGVSEVTLNVFGFNGRARRLYDSLGYQVVRTYMIKKLD